MGSAGARPGPRGRGAKGLPEPAAPVRVDGYGGSGFTVSGEPRTGPLLLLPERAVPWEGADEPLGPGAAEVLVRFAAGAEVLLLGLGVPVRPPGPDFLDACRKAGFAPDVMDTGAACRTWNVLAGEGRAVAAGLLPARAPGGAGDGEPARQDPS